MQFSRYVHLLSWNVCYCQAVMRTAEEFHCVNYNIYYEIQCTYTSYCYTLYLMGKTYHCWKHRVIQLAIHVVFLWGTPEQDVLTEKQTNDTYWTWTFFQCLDLNNTCSFLTTINVQDSTCRVVKLLSLWRQGKHVHCATYQLSKVINIIP